MVCIVAVAALVIRELHTGLVVDLLMLRRHGLWVPDTSISRNSDQFRQYMAKLLCGLTEGKVEQPEQLV